MVRGRSTTVRAAVTLGAAKPPAQLLHSSGVLLLSVGGLLAAVAVVVSAALGLWRIRGRRETGAAGDPGSDGDAAGAG
jgi:hypothetical protein